MDLKTWVIAAANEVEGQHFTIDTVILWVVLRLLGDLNGWAPLKLLSGYRDPAYQKALRDRWDRGDREGLAVRPAEVSQHSAGRAFDVEPNPDIELYGKAAKEIGARWGGSFASKDALHFDTRDGLRRA